MLFAPISLGNEIFIRRTAAKDSCPRLPSTKMRRFKLVRRQHNNGPTPLFQDFQRPLSEPARLSGCLAVYIEIVEYQTGRKRPEAVFLNDDGRRQD